MQIDTVKQIADELKKANMVYIIGNGGSAALADHFACDLLKNCHLPAISLCSNQSLITAIGNDYSFSDIFLKQLEILFEKRDVLVAFSTSGQSENVLKAMHYAKKIHNIVIGISGRHKGSLFEQYSTIFYRIKARNMQDCENKMVEFCHKLYKEVNYGRKG